jgi:hypothetical protein
MEGGEAAFRTPPPPAAAARIPILTEPRPALRPTPAPEKPSDPSALLGRIEHHDGRVQAVISDGPWVKLVPEVDQRPSAVALAAASFPTGIEMPLAESDTDIWDNRQSPSADQPGQAIPNSVEALGIVEWQSGRVAAVVASPNSVEIVEAGAEVPAAQRELASSPEQGASSDTMRYFAVMPGGRPEEKDAVVSRWAMEESEPRGPPGHEPSAESSPEEIARGQPEGLASGYSIRGPPSELATAFVELPGIEDSTAARLEPLGSIQFLTQALLGLPRDPLAESVPGIRAEKPILAVSTGHSAPDTHANDAVLGTIRTADGRELDILLRSGSVVIEESGRANQPAVAASTVASHPALVGAHPTAGEISAPGLPTGRSIRDNQSQSRR